MTEVYDPQVHATAKGGGPVVNKDGSFRKKRSDAGSSARTSAPRQKSSGGSQRAKYEEGVAGLLQIPAMAISFVNPVDGFCVAQHTPPIAKAVADLAVERPEVAAALDKVLAVGPYGALIGAVLPLAVQLMHNHNMIPEPMAKSMGAHSKQDIERHLKVVASQPQSQPERDRQDDEPLTTEAMVSDAA